ncbi:MAG: sugar transferase [Waddliaceae bacterium]
MPKPKTLKGIDRSRLLEELHNRYTRPASFRQKIRYWRKKYLWLFFIEGTKLFKRVTDIVLSAILLIVLSPLMLLIAAIIKLNDGGPALYDTQRVGKWGKEFTFPKFRTMELKADQKKEQLRKFNAHKDDIKFKIRGDPRNTKLGHILRISSLDELPQLWCVLKGEMSLVGPRPPLPEEVAKYDLQQRKRLDITPGLTCIWQVSGRSELPFKEQVELDIAYIESQSVCLDMKLILQTIPAILFGKGAY